MVAYCLLGEPKTCRWFLAVLHTVCWRPCSAKKNPRRSKHPKNSAFLDVQWNTFLQWLTFNVWTCAKQSRLNPWLWKPYRFAKKPYTVNFPSVRLGNGFLKAGQRPLERMEEKVQSCCVPKFVSNRSWILKHSTILSTDWTRMRPRNLLVLWWQGLIRWMFHRSMTGSN